MDTQVTTTFETPLARVIMPQVRSYGHYSNDNYGLNSLMVDLGGFRLYYSYNTIVAYYDYQDGLTVAKNVWTTTTGKHLNWIDGGGARKSERLEYEVFQAKLQAAMARHIH